MAFDIDASTMLGRCWSASQPAREGEGLVEGRPSHPHGVRGDDGTPRVEGSHGGLEAGARLGGFLAAEQARGGNAAILQGERGGLVGLESHLLLDPEAPETGRALLDEGGAVGLPPLRGVEGRLH
jgi:hypothetical protein